MQPAFLVDIKFKRILLKVVLNIFILFADHIDMCLQNDGFTLFIAFRCRLVNDHVPDFILHIGIAVFLGEIDDIIADRLFVAAAARDLGDLVEVITVFLRKIKFHSTVPPLSIDYSRENGVVCEFELIFRINRK